MDLELVSLAFPKPALCRSSADIPVSCMFLEVWKPESQVLARVQPVLLALVEDNWLQPELNSADIPMNSLLCSLHRFVHLHSKALTNKLFKRAGKMGWGTHESSADAGLPLAWLILSHGCWTTELVSVWLVVCSLLTGVPALALWLKVQFED